MRAQACYALIGKSVRSKSQEADLGRPVCRLQNHALTDICNACAKGGHCDGVLEHAQVFSMPERYSIT